MGKQPQCYDPTVSYNWNTTTKHVWPLCQHHHFLTEQITCALLGKKHPQPYVSAFKLTWFISGTSSSLAGQSPTTQGSGSEDDSESGFPMGHEKRGTNRSSILKAPFRVMFRQKLPQKAMDYGNWSDYVIAFCGHSESVQVVERMCRFSSDFGAAEAHNFLFILMTSYDYISHLFVLENLAKYPTWWLMLRPLPVLPPSSLPIFFPLRFVFVFLGLYFSAFCFILVSSISSKSIYPPAN